VLFHNFATAGVDTLHHLYTAQLLKRNVTATNPSLVMVSDLAEVDVGGQIADQVVLALPRRTSPQGPVANVAVRDTWQIVVQVHGRFTRSRGIDELDDCTGSEGRLHGDEGHGHALRSTGLE